MSDRFTSVVLLYFIIVIKTKVCTLKLYILYMKKGYLMCNSYNSYWYNMYLNVFLKTIKFDLKNVLL